MEDRLRDLSDHLGTDSLRAFETISARYASCMQHNCLNLSPVANFNKANGWSQLLKESALRLDRQWE